MDSALMDLKKKAYSLLRDALVNGLDNGEISLDDMRLSARYITLHLKLTDNYRELMILLKQIGDKWPAYKKSYITLKTEQTVYEDKIKLEQLQQKLRQFTHK